MYACIVSMYVCMYLLMCIFTDVGVDFMCICLNVHVCLYVCVSVCILIFMHACIYVCIICNVHAYVCMSFFIIVSMIKYLLYRLLGHCIHVCVSCVCVHVDSYILPY